MRTHQATTTTSTDRCLDFVDVTDEVEAELERSGIRDGHVTVFVRDPACALILNERESGLWRDLRATLERLEHIDPAARRTALGSASLVLPAVRGRLRLGRWQRILLIECGDAAARAVSVQITGE